MLSSIPRSFISFPISIFLIFVAYFCKALPAVCSVALVAHTAGLSALPQTLPPGILAAFASNALAPLAAPLIPFAAPPAIAPAPAPNPALAAIALSLRVVLKPFSAQPNIFLAPSGA